MANGSFNVGTSNANISGTLSWVSTSDIGSNSSNVYFELRFSRTNTGFTSSGNGTWWVRINGEKVESSHSFTYSYNSNTLVVYGNVNVQHNVDGKKETAIEVGGNTSSHSIIDTGVNVRLDDIPRASTSSTATWTFPNNFDISLFSSSPDFYHAIGIDVYNNSTGSWEEIKTIWDATGTAINVNSNFQSHEQDHILALLNVGLNYAEMTRIRVYTSTVPSNGNQIGYNEYVGGICYSPEPTDLIINNFNVTDNVPYNFSNNSFYYDLKATIGSYTKTFLTKSSIATTSFTWDTSVTVDKNSILDTLPTSNSGNITWELTSYSLNNGIYRKIKDTVIKTCSVTIPNSIKNPIWSNSGILLDETNNTIKTLFGTNSPSYIVSGLSKLDVTLNNIATALRGTTIKQYNVTINSNNKLFAGNAIEGSKISFNEIEIRTTNSSLIMTINVVDNRGNTTSLTPIIINVLQYSKPTINAKAEREGGFYPTTTLSLNGVFSPLTINSVNKNSIKTLQYQYKEDITGSSYGSLFTITKSGSTPNYIGANTNINNPTGLDSNKQWKVKVLVTDEIGVWSTEITVYVGKPIMFVDSEKKSVGVGRFPKGEGTFEIEGDEYLNGIKITEVKTAPSTPNGGMTVAENVCSYASNSDNVTGILKITLPFGMNNVMFQMTIDGFNYGSQNMPSAFTLVLGGYAYSYGEFFSQTGDLVGKAPFGNNGTVRLAKDTVTNKACILLGLTTTNTWSYPRINVSKIMVGTSSFGYVNLRDGWDVSFITSESGLSSFKQIDNVSELERTYPVGAIHMNTSGVNPSIRMGGTWVAWGSGRVPVGVDTAQIEFNTVEKVGGEKTHSLIASELPPDVYVDEPSRGTPMFVDTSTTGSRWLETVNNTNMYGGNGHNILQPYITCYMWKRIS